MSWNKTIMTFAVMGAFFSSCETISDNVVKSDAFEAVPQSSNKDIRIQKNYQKMYDNISGAWFSYNNTDLMRKALKYASSIPHGRDILARIKNPPSIISSRNFKDKVSGSHDNYILRRSSDSILQEVNSMKVRLSRKIVNPETMDACSVVLMHELLHHVQKEFGIDSKKHFFSPTQMMLLEKLCEAETGAWDDVLKVGYRFLDENGTHINGGIQNFMQMNLVAQAKKEAAEAGKKFNENKFKSYDPRYLLQQALIANGGNREQAEKNVVRKRLVLYMSKYAVDERIANWRADYDWKSISNTNLASSLYHLTTVGDPKFEEILDHYAETYHISKSQINTLYLRKEAEPYAQESIRRMHAMGLLVKGNELFAEFKAKKRGGFSQKSEHTR